MAEADLTLLGENVQRIIDENREIRESLTDVRRGMDQVLGVVTELRSGMAMTNTRLRVLEDRFDQVLGRLEQMSARLDGIDGARP